MAEEGSPRSSRSRPGRRLLIFGIVVSLTHHLGLLTDPLGSVGSTHWNDWLDLLVPFLVVGSAGCTMLAARPDRRAWVGFAVGAVAYVEGHGLHLAANAIDNASPSSTAHLYDEVVGHAVWFTGLALLVVALVRALRAVPLRVTWAGWVVATAFGVTAATNAVGGGTVAGSLLVAAAFTAYGVLRRAEPRGRLLVVTFGVTVLGLVGHLLV